MLRKKYPFKRLGSPNKFLYRQYRCNLTANCTYNNQGRYLPRSNE